MEIIDNIIATINKFNYNIVKKADTSFTHDAIFLNNVEDEEEQKWFNCTCNAEDYSLDESFNLTEDELQAVEEMLLYLHVQYREEAQQERMERAFDRYNYNN